MKLTGKKELIDILKERVEVSFKDFMEIVLYYPNLGYYTSKKEKIGSYGDFYTSSELDPVFGNLLAKQFYENYKNYFNNQKIKIVEIGSGKGLLAYDVLSYIKENFPDFYKNIEFISVEKSTFHLDLQKKLLKDFDNIIFLQDFNELNNIYGIIYSNELFDALPVNVIVKKDGKIFEIYLKIQNDNVEEILKEPSEEILEYLKELAIDIPEGMRTEINLIAKNLIINLGNKLKKGFLYTVDYGYPSKELYKPYRMRGTLLCYYKHTYNESFYENIGLQDITSHVNFSALTYYGKKVGLDFVGFTDQAHFLINLGLMDIFQKLQENGDYKSYERLNRLKTLIMPQGMGEKFKVLIQSKNIDNPKLTGLDILPYHSDRYKIEV